MKDENFPICVTDKTTLSQGHFQICLVKTTSGEKNPDFYQYA